MNRRAGSEQGHWSRVGGLSCSLVARFQDDYGRLGRTQGGIAVVLRINRDPSLPKPITLLADGAARVHLSHTLACQSNDGVRVRLKLSHHEG